MVNKILSGHATSTNVDLRSFDSQTRSTIFSFQRHLLSACDNLQAAQHNINQAVLDKPDGRALRYLNDHRISQIQSYLQDLERRPDIRVLRRNTKQKVIDHQSAVINHFTTHVKLQDARTDALEADMNDIYP
ncbi:LOW QUALITY PROTEIN: Hypothetical protein PHPALM_12241 [Phytophthora palmivora]|uniref:Uncharacterized protein n=1 Tax=Phytophthora palmivora TaxID=4796 RepID=A0A2P4Y082_9STRA|nr:LOW QUALITY PROTEIN: Hypothetical protein PHPALM_12241 [Phytophthora palmivora]